MTRTKNRTSRDAVRSRKTTYRTKSNRIKMREDQQLVKLESGKYTVDPISLIMLGIGIAVYSYLKYKTFQEDVEGFFDFFTSLFLVMMIGGFLGGAMMQLVDNGLNSDKAKINFANVDEIFGLKNKWEAVRQALYFAICFVGIMVIQFLVGLIQAITSLDLFLFYSFAAVAEEFFYRFFITQTLQVVIYKIAKSFNAQRKSVSDFVIMLISTIISTIGVSFFFQISHYGRYGDKPAILLGVLLASFLITAVYILSKNLLIVLLSHLLVNFIAFGSYLQIFIEGVI